MLTQNRPVCHIPAVGPFPLVLGGHMFALWFMDKEPFMLSVKGDYRNMMM